VCSSDAATDADDGVGISPPGASSSSKSRLRRFVSSDEDSDSEYVHEDT